MTRDSDDPDIMLLLLAVLVVAIVARRLDTAPSILLVVAGIVPGLPRIEPVGRIGIT